MNKKLRCYYAHTMTSYGSTIEQQDVELLESLGFEVINPNQKKYQDGCLHGWCRFTYFFILSHN